MKKILTIYLLLIGTITFAQKSDSILIRNIYKNALTNNVGYDNLRYLCKNIGERICGSENAQKAVEWAEINLKKLGADTVYKQEVPVTHWIRGEKEIANIKVNGQEIFLNISSIGPSIGTGNKGISAEVIEVESFEELKKIDKSKIEGKMLICFIR